METMKGTNETVPSPSPCRLDGRNCDCTRHPSECLVRNSASGAELSNDDNCHITTIYDNGAEYLVISNTYYKHVRAAYDLILNCGFIDNDLDSALKHLGVILNGKPYEDSSTADRPSSEHPSERSAENRNPSVDQSDNGNPHYRLGLRYDAFWT